MIPFVDLKTQYNSIRAEIDSAIQRVIDNSAFIGGNEVKKFEEEFTEFCQSAGCVAVANGTDALYLTLRALGIKPGDEVITVANTFIATAEAITSNGAIPVFIDIKDDTLLMDVDKLEKAISPRTKAILAVHLYGQPCNMEAIAKIGNQYNLKIVEDAAQAHGAFWNGQAPGALSDAACFSFYPGKNLGAYGDGGAVVSKEIGLLENIKMLANHGRLEKYTHQFPGVNSRLDGIQAAVLRVKLKHLAGWNLAREQNAKRYLANLAYSQLTLPFVDPKARSAWHLFVIRASNRELMQRKLKTAGIESGIHYPVPLHLQPAYSFLQYTKGQLPITEVSSAEVLSLPLFPELKNSDIDYICSTILSTENDQDKPGMRFYAVQ
jgi:dTDP-4-amino-4,6-dideoxygalactose transaminase